MPGETTTGSLSDSLPSIIADARIVREYEGTWMRTCERRNLDANTGLSWQEIALGQVQAMDITETTQNNNAQSIADTLFSITPLMSQILIKITDRTMRRIAAVVKSKVGTLAGNAMARKKDEDYLATFSTFNGNADPGANTAFANGFIAAAVARITNNATEPAMGPIFAILHAFQVYDIERAIVPAGTSALAAAITDDLGNEVFRKGLRGEVHGAFLYTDGNIQIDSNDDAIGAVHAKEAVVAVSGMAIRTAKDRDEAFGGGADEIYMTDEYGFGERSAGNWAYSMVSDATAPTG